MSRRALALSALAACLMLLVVVQCQQETNKGHFSGAAQVVAKVAQAAPGPPGTSPHSSSRHWHYRRPVGASLAFPNGTEPLGCDDVTKLDPGDDLCAFVTSHCEVEGLINYPKLYYCHVAPHGALLTALMLVLCTCLLALLFRLIARAADDFFSCILSQISQDLGLPPRLGGVTLLALGNGAPDLSASIAAVKSGNYQLAMGALTGAGMFVGGVVAGRIVTLSGGVRARGAQLRDISTQFITVAVVAGIVVSGWFTYGGVAALLSIYAAYVLVVAVADFSKRAGVEWAEVARKVSRRMSGRWRVEMVAPLLEADHGASTAGSMGSLPPGRLTSAAIQQQQQQQQQYEGQMLLEGGLAAAGQGFADQEAAGSGRTTPLSEQATSVPGSLSALQPARSATPPPQRTQHARFASLPDFHAAQRRQQQQSYWQAAPQQHLRNHPPVAHFQPRVAYSDLVQMPAAEYRRRALAEMAQSRSFYVRERREQQGRLPSTVEEGQASYDSDGSSSGESEAGWEDGLSRPSSRGAEWQASGSGGSYQPPAVSFEAAALQEQPGHAAEESLQQGANAAAAAADAAEAGAVPLPGRGQQQQEEQELQSLAEQQQQQQQPQQQQQGHLYGPTEQHYNAQYRRRSSSQSRPSDASNTPRHSIGSFEMMGAPQSMAEAAAAALAEVDGERRGRSDSRAGSPPLPWAAPAGASAQAGEQAIPPGSTDSPAGWEPDGKGVQARLVQGLEAAQRPLLLMLQATIPLVEVNSYDRRWFLRSLAASPLFICAYLRLFSWQALLVAVATGALMAAAGHLGTRRLQGKAPLWTFGTGYPIGAALVAMYGFAVAAMWISLFASEIVGLLQFFGILSKMDPAVLGVTVLAWGNSLMDYMNNTAMAGRSRGGNSMAMTACFAGPLFNMLVGLGLGFWALLEESGTGRTAVEMDPVVLVGCLFIMIHCAGLVAVSLTHRQHLPAWCGWAMVAGYGAYLSVVLAVITIT